MLKVLLKFKPGMQENTEKYTHFFFLFFHIIELKKYLKDFLALISMYMAQLFLEKKTRASLLA